MRLGAYPAMQDVHLLSGPQLAHPVKHKRGGALQAVWSLERVLGVTQVWHVLAEAQAAQLVIPQVSQTYIRGICFYHGV